MKPQNVNEMKEHLKIISQHILSEGVNYSTEQVKSSLRSLGTSLDTLMEEEKNSAELNNYLKEWEALNEIDSPLINLTD